jgi:hypothetical protein
MSVDKDGISGSVERFIEMQEQKTEEAAEQEDYIRRFIEFVGLCQPHEIRIEELFWPAGTSRN